jgi:hypothetical protein
MAAPKKIKFPPMDLRTHDSEPDNFAAMFRQSQINRLRVDQLGDEPLACVLAPVILKRASAGEIELAGEMFVHMLADCTADQAEAFFKRVVTLKRNAEGLPHRNGFAYYAYARFIEETGREPSKAELKRYILARREIYRDAPGEGDKEGWTRLWIAAGLFTLPNGVKAKR